MNPRCILHILRATKMFPGTYGLIGSEVVSVPFVTRNSLDVVTAIGVPSNICIGTFFLFLYPLRSNTLDIRC